MPLLGGGSGSAHEVKDYPLASLDADDVQHVLYPVNVEESASPPNCSELQGQELQLIGLPSILALSRLFGVSKVRV